MKITKIKYFVLTIFILNFLGFQLENATDYKKTSECKTVIKQQAILEGNNIRSYIWNSGVFDQNLSSMNTPGFEWPKGSGKLAVFTAGFTIGAYFEGNLRLAAASYSGEYCPGYINNGVFQTDTWFKIYNVKSGDNYINNPDWLNWGLMVPFGAPYIDVNHNGLYEYNIDTPGVRSAAQTIFICLTDGDPSNHTPGEGFGGGTLPLFAEAHLTAWCYNTTGLQDIQFFKWVVINKSQHFWNRTFFSIVGDPDLGDAVDDHLGCDTLRRLSYCYNADNMDGSGTGSTYGLNPPAVGFLILKGAIKNDVTPNVNLGMSSFVYIRRPGSWFTLCEQEPSNTLKAYNFMRGLKNDSTSWLCPTLTPFKKTKYVLSGDPETSEGWTAYKGRVDNCNGDTTGNLIIPIQEGDQKFCLSSGAENLNIMPGDTQTIIAAQLIARGTSNLNSVTKLKQLADVAIQLYNNGFVIGVEPISSEVPQQFVLYQNYPNPFNPTTKIKFSVPAVGQRHAFDVRLVIYDILGREVETLINEGLKPGTYEVDWNGSNYPSGIYFYKLTAYDRSASSGQGFSETRKMVLLK